MVNKKYDESDHLRAFEAYKACGSIYQVSDDLGIAYNTLVSWSKEFPACNCPHHNWDAQYLMEGSADEQLQLVLGKWGLDEVEERLSPVDLVTFRSWMRIFATSLFFACGDIPSVLRDVNGNALSAAELRKRCGTVRKPSYKESIETLRMSRSEIQAILKANKIDTTTDPVSDNPASKVPIDTLRQVQRIFEELPRVDMEALNEFFCCACGVNPIDS